VRRVPGGAVALLNVSQKMMAKGAEGLGLGTKSDEIVGFEIVRMAIESPFRKLMENAGLDSGTK